MLLCESREKFHCYGVHSPRFWTIQVARKVRMDPPTAPASSSPDPLSMCAKRRNEVRLGDWQEPAAHRTPDGHLRPPAKNVISAIILHSPEILAGFLHGRSGVFNVCVLASLSSTMFFFFFPLACHPMMPLPLTPAAVAASSSPVCTSVCSQCSSASVHQVSETHTL